jgi:hypothetical protein
MDSAEYLAGKAKEDSTNKCFLVARIGTQSINKPNNRLLAERARAFYRIYRKNN